MYISEQFKGDILTVENTFDHVTPKCLILEILQN